MKIIREDKVGKESTFNVQDKIGTTVLNSYDIRIQGCSIKSRGITNFLIYNSACEVISDSYSFLNKSAKSRAINTRRNYMYSLKYLYSFMEIIEKNVYSLQLEDFYQLAAFLKGVSATGSDFEYNLLTNRSNKTINIFFSAYREYFKYLGLSKSQLFQEHSFSKFIPLPRKIVGKTLKRDTTPEYISKDEYKKIMNILDSESEEVLRSKCLIRLMYESGLRIGEVLGLTLEDFQIRKARSGNTHCIILIRNRLTNNENQQAKTCMKITDIRNYGGHDFATRNLGYQEAIFLDSDGINTYDLICEYIDLAHAKAMKKYPGKYKTTVADSVDAFKHEGKENHYLFLNSIGGLLGDESWNKQLRSIFSKASIAVDSGYRKHNLNHRFRHGFVMAILYDKKVPISQAKVFTRHKSDAGLFPYNNPTVEDIMRLKEELSEENGIINILEEVKKNES